MYHEEDNIMNYQFHTVVPKEITNRRAGIAWTHGHTRCEIFLIHVK
jgi:hypothetical protein